jgi:hypothetical protein
MAILASQNAHLSIKPSEEPSRVSRLLGAAAVASALILIAPALSTSAAAADQPDLLASCAAGLSPSVSLISYWNSPQEAFLSPSPAGRCGYRFSTATETSAILELDPVSNFTGSISANVYSYQNGHLLGPVAGVSDYHVVASSPSPPRDLSLKAGDWVLNVEADESDNAPRICVNPVSCEWWGILPTVTARTVAGSIGASVWRKQDGESGTGSLLQHSWASRRIADPVGPPAARHTITTRTQTCAPKLTSRENRDTFSAALPSWPACL